MLNICPSGACPMCAKTTVRGGGGRGIHQFGRVVVVDNTNNCFEIVFILVVFIRGNVEESLFTGTILHLALFRKSNCRLWS